jgi:predicted  nucleic acid-binding Zn-ribbon protein
MSRKQVKSRSRAPKAEESPDKKLAKLEKFELEYDSLKAERAKLRDEITELDSKVANKKISKKQHTKEYRIRLSKAAEISRRLAQVVGEMARLGKIPADRLP